MLTRLRRAALVALAALVVSPVTAGAEDRVVYVGGTRDGFSDLYTVRPDGTGARRLTRDRAFETMPEWSPDRSRIVYQRQNRDGSYDVWVMDADGTHERRLTRSPRNDLRPTWSPDGKWITWLHEERETYIGEVRMMRPDGSGRRTLIRRARGFGWEWSPDSEKVSFSLLERCRGCSYRDYEVAVVDVGTGRVRRLTRNRWMHDGGAVWRPDGRRLAFLREPMRKYPRVYTMKPDGSRKRKVGIVKSTVSTWQWSPDGRKIVIGLRDGNVLDPEKIKLLDVPTGKRRLVSEWSFGFARWSPDGRRIAYTAPARVDGKEGRAIFSVGRDLKRRKRIVATRRGLGVFDW